MEAKRLHWTSILIEAQQFSWSLFALLIVSSGNLRPSQLLTLFGIENVEGTYLEYILGWIVFPIFFGFLYIRWRRFRYHLRADEIYAVSGGFFKKETHIPYGQIQAVDSKMGSIHRLFKVSQLRIKTASTGTQLDLASIENRDALESSRVD